MLLWFCFHHRWDSGQTIEGPTKRKRLQEKKCYRAVWIGLYFGFKWFGFGCKLRRTPRHFPVGNVAHSPLVGKAKMVSNAFLFSYSPKQCASVSGFSGAIKAPVCSRNGLLETANQSNIKCVSFLAAQTVAGRKKWPSAKGSQKSKGFMRWRPKERVLWAKGQ